MPPLIDSVVVTVHVAPVPPTFSQTVYTAEILEFTSQVKTHTPFSVQVLSILVKSV